ncbi:MAG TPA: PAS domain-containing sensor histidine kinase [Candidatus Saccharibacteria bacterium]|nr:PAS domain-containing sensor histidine kinase [Candidatus Saccharibacteria bacterium]HRK93758.1 PAS domain-containing sensor histidine kinase [Candidatus Saccharibacteria bacterium]
MTARIDTTRNRLTKLLTRHNETLAELKRYKELVENVQDYAIFLMDKNGYVQTWNKGAKRTNGYSASEIIGKHFSIFYPKEDIKKQKPQQELIDAQKFGRIEDEGWRIHKDGSKFWSNVIITALFDDSGTLTGFAKVTRNLTERKIQEDKLKKANVLLKRQQEELKRLNGAKDEFISLASHQLRTPATAIKQLLGIILEGFAGDVPPHLLPPIQKSYESNERLIRIVNSLLKVAQIDAGKVVLDKTDVKINDLVRDVILEQQKTILARKQTVTFVPKNVSLTVQADPQYFRMALENLVDNASKYTFDGGTIEVTTKSQKDDIVVAISDNGVGIASENLASLFEKFQRIPNDLSQSVVGSGLGLYWVKKVIELHDGRIEVKSEVGKGTTFTIYLPKRK